MDTKRQGWVGEKLRHQDGRTGKIISQDEGLWYTRLTVAVDSDGTAEMICLNCNGKDSGALGWTWNSLPECWSPLGDHNNPEYQAYLARQAKE